MDDTVWGELSTGYEICMGGFMPWCWRNSSLWGISEVFFLGKFHLQYSLDLKVNVTCILFGNWEV